MTEHGIEAPAHMDVKVVENTDDTVHIVLPQALQGGDLSDAEVSDAAGGPCNLTSFLTCFNTYYDGRVNQH